MYVVHRNVSLKLIIIVLQKPKEGDDDRGAKRYPDDRDDHDSKRKYVLNEWMALFN